jgi:hypothetical protein
VLPESPRSEQSASVTKCELAQPGCAIVSTTGYSKGTGAEELHRLPAMTLAQVRQAKAAEKAAKDAFYALHVTIKTGDKTPANYSKLQGAMIAATKARNEAMTAYAATLVG